jgi:AraC-like DNA-binding protein
LSVTGDGYWVRSLAETYRAGGRIPRHDHPWGQLVYATSGVMHVTTPHMTWLVPPTRAIWLPPCLAHEISMQGATALRTLYIAPERAKTLAGEAVALEVAPLLRELILHILSIGMLDPARDEHDRLARLLIDLLVQARPYDLALPLPRDPRALSLAERLQATPDERADFKILARAAGASLRTLQRIFPAETGLTLEAWRRKARLIHGAARLIEGSSVTTAALDCGYDSVSAFIAAFKAAYGVTPARFRTA